MGPTSTPTPTSRLTGGRPGPGDANCDGRISAADLTALTMNIVNGTHAPCGLDDVNRDSQVDSDDIAALVAVLFGPSGTSTQ